MQSRDGYARASEYASMKDAGKYINYMEVLWRLRAIRISQIKLALLFFAVVCIGSIAIALSSKS